MRGTGKKWELQIMLDIVGMLRLKESASQQYD